jgi:hypothetical protein
MAKPAFASIFFLSLVAALSPASAQQAPGQGSVPAPAGAKIALVIGNGAYQAAPLRNPPNDAKDMAAALGRLGFSVTSVVDGDQKQMKRAIDDFGDRCRGASIALFYYSGHGVQVNGENWLIPVRSEIGEARDVEYEGVQLGRVLAAMESSGATTSVLILDACRNNPFPGSERAATRGLAVVGHKPPESVIVYSTEANETALDGEGRNGTFTAALLRNLERPGLSLNGILMAVNAEVRQTTANRQRPARYDNLTREVYLASVSGSLTKPARGGPEGQSPTISAPKKPSLVVQRAYGSVRIETQAIGTLYFAGEALGEIRPGAEAVMNDIEAGPAALEMRYADGTVEKLLVTVAKDAETLASFVQGPKPADANLPRAGLVAEWLFDGNARDSGGGGYHGEVHGAKLSEDRFGKAGKAYKFEGKEWIEVASKPGLNFGAGAFTIAFWLKTSGDCGNESDDYFISKYKDDDTQGWCIKERNAGLALLTNAQDWEQTFQDKQINDGTWKFIVAMRGSDGRKILYTDLARTLDYQADDHDVTNDYVILFGRNGKDDWNAKCSLDDIRIYNRMLSEAEITALYRAGGWKGKAVIHDELSIPRSGLVAEWLLDGDAKDSGEGGYDGSVVGAKPTTNRFGKQGKALRFDGGELVRVPSRAELNFGTGDYSVAFWLKTEGNCGSDSDDYFIAKYTTDDGKGWSIKERDGGLALLTTDKEWDQTFQDQKINDGTWKFIVVTRRSDGRKLVYVDLAKTLDYAAAVHDVSNDADLLFGRNEPYNYYTKCSIDDVRIYNRSLSEIEMKALYEEGGWKGK